MSGGGVGDNHLAGRLTLSAGELSKMTGLSRWTIYDLVGQRRIPHARVGRRLVFPVKAIEEWLDDNTVGANDA